MVMNPGSSTDSRRTRQGVSLTGRAGSRKARVKEVIGHRGMEMVRITQHHLSTVLALVNHILTKNPHRATVGAYSELGGAKCRRSAGRLTFGPTRRRPRSSTG